MKKIIQIDRGENLRRIAHKIKKHRKDEYLPSKEEVATVKEMKEVLREILHLQQPQYHWEYKCGGYFRDISGNKPTELTIYDRRKKIKLTVLIEYRRLAAIRTESEEIVVMSKEERRRNQENWGVMYRGCWRNKRKEQEEACLRREEEIRRQKEKEMAKRWKNIWKEAKGLKMDCDRERSKIEQEEQEFEEERQRETVYMVCMGYAFVEEYGERY